MEIRYISRNRFKSNNRVEGTIGQYVRASKQKHYDVVGVMDIDRLSSNDFDALQIFKILSDFDIVIVTPSRIYDWTKNGDSLLLKIESLIAAQEYE